MSGTGNRLRTIMRQIKDSSLSQAVLWLFGKLWAWEPLSFILGAVCIGVGIPLAQERMYGLARSLVCFGAVIVLLKLVHDALAEKKPKKVIVAASVTAGIVLFVLALSAWQLIKRIEWNHEVVIKLTFKSSPVLTSARQEKMIWELNKYHRFLSDLGFDVPTDFPPIGVSPPHSIFSCGGTVGAPSYYSSVYIPEDAIDNLDSVRFMYSKCFFNRFFIDINTPSRAEAVDDATAEWVYSCYYPATFSEQQVVCLKDMPAQKWIDALWEVRQKYGAEYADKLLCYSFKMWRAIPAKYSDNFDRFFRYKLVAGESVADNAGGERHKELDSILQRHGIDTALP